MGRPPRFLQHALSCRFHGRAGSNITRPMWIVDTREYGQHALEYEQSIGGRPMVRSFEQRDRR
eukprot:4703519-Alexandrium_andersonii.AAC.1